MARGLSLDVVMEMLSVDAQDFFVSCLQQDFSGRSAYIARCVSRGMRSLVDGSIRKAHLTLHEGHFELWHDGTSSPLRRWHRCNHVTVSMDAEAVGDPMLAADLLALPFVGLPAEVPQSITSLSLDLGGGDPFDPAYDGGGAVEYLIPAAALAAVLRSLPSLQRVRLHDGLPSGRLQQRQLYDALASPPHLVELEMRCCEGLHDIDLLADKLTVLKVTEDYHHCLSVDLLAVLTGLKAGRGKHDLLRQLTLELLSYDARLVRSLLHNLQSELQLLRLSVCEAVRSPPDWTAEFHLQDRCLTSLDVQGEVRVNSLAQLSSHLLSSASVKPRLRQVCLRHVAVGSAADDDRTSSSDSDGERVDGGGSSSSSTRKKRHVENLRKLLRLAANVEVGVLRIGSNASLQEALEGFTLFSGYTKELELEVGPPLPGKDIRIRLGPLAPMPTAADAEPAAGAGPPPNAPCLLEMAVQRLTGGAAGVRLYAAASTTADSSSAGVKVTGQGADSGSCFGNSSDGTSIGGGMGGTSIISSSGVPYTDPRLLLLRGRLLSDAAKHGNDAFYDWLFGLKDQEYEICIATQHHRLGVYVMLPWPGAVVIACCGAAGVANVEAAARAVVAAAAAEPTVTGDANEPELQLIPVTMAVHVDLRLPLDSARSSFTEVFGKAVQEEAQRAWNGDGFSSGWTYRQRLQWLLEQSHEQLW